MMLNKLTGPGLFRLFLALMVFVHHCTRFSVGTSAVYIFFCLSGYWIQKMYAGRYSKTRWPYFTYIVSRFWRLLPTFWLVSLITFGVMMFGGLAPDLSPKSNSIHFALSNLLILGYLTLPAKLIVPAWSLDVEMRFYLVAPLIVIALASRKKRNVYYLLAIAAIVSISSTIFYPDVLLDYLVYFVIGMVAASLDWRPTKQVSLLSFFGTSALILCCLASPWRGVLLVGAHPGPLAAYTSYANVVIALLMSPFAIFTTGQKAGGTDKMFADLSYIIYLLHWVGFLWIEAHPGGYAHGLVGLATVWVLVLAMSLVVWKCYDHPINQLRARWVSRRAAEVPKIPSEQAHAETVT